jgi:hypothetical protein
MKCGRGHDHSTVAEVRACYGLSTDAKPSEVAAATKAWSGRNTDVPEGRYAIQAHPTKPVEFYKVDRPTLGRWAGYTFVKQLIGSPGHLSELPVRDRAQRGDILAEIGRDVRYATVLFGRKLGMCGRCGSPLTNVRSRAAGYGERCAEIMGWPYPTEQEAMNILQELGINYSTAEIDFSEAPTFSDGRPDYSINRTSER